MNHQASREDFELEETYKPLVPLLEDFAGLFRGRVGGKIPDRIFGVPRVVRE